MQEIQNEFIEKFPELKDFPVLAMEMQTFLHKACICYVEGIVPETNKDFDMSGIEVVNYVLTATQEDSLLTS